MKKILTMTFFSILCAGMLSGCGTDYDTADSTVFAFKDGSIVSTDVEKFDTGTYDKDDLEKYVDRFCTGQEVTRERTDKPDGSVIFDINTDGLAQRISFCEA